MLRVLVMVMWTAADADVAAAGGCGEGYADDARMMTMLAALLRAVVLMVVLRVRMLLTLRLIKRLKSEH